MPGIETLLADLVGQDEAAAEAAVAALAAQGKAAALALLKLLDSENAEHRWWAVRALAGLADPPRDVFARALGDTDAEVRAAAALALTKHPDPGSVPALVKLLSDTDHVTAVLAAGAMVSVGEAAVPLLIDAYEHASQSGRIHILRALAELRDPRAIGLLMRALDQDSAVMQYWAQRALERLGLNMVYLKPD